MQRDTRGADRDRGDAQWSRPACRHDGLREDQAVSGLTPPPTDGVPEAGPDPRQRPLPEIVVRQLVHAGPLPAPSQVADYEAVYPGAARWIIEQAEKNAAHLREMELRRTRASASRTGFRLQKPTHIAACRRLTEWDISGVAHPTSEPHGNRPFGRLTTASSDSIALPDIMLAKERSD